MPLRRKIRSRHHKDLSTVWRYTVHLGFLWYITPTLHATTRMSQSSQISNANQADSIVSILIQQKPLRKGLLIPSRIPNLRREMSENHVFTCPLACQMTS